MDTNQANLVIVEMLQNILVGELKPESKINPKNIADAIAAKIVFGKNYKDSNLDSIIGYLIDRIMILKKEAQDEFDNMRESGLMTNNPEEKPLLLQNFIKGKITAYEEILAELKK